MSRSVLTCVHHVSWVRPVAGGLHQCILCTQVVTKKDVYPKLEDLSDDFRRRWDAHEATRPPAPPAAAERAPAQAARAPAEAARAPVDSARTAAEAARASPPPVSVARAPVRAPVPASGDPAKP